MCGRCVGRFDHHCVWIHNCVGLGNTAHFVGFLAANVAVCVYGMSTFVIVAIAPPIPSITRHVRGACVHGR